MCNYGRSTYRWQEGAGQGSDEHPFTHNSLFCEEMSAVNKCSKDRFLHNECDENRGCSDHRLRLTPSCQVIQVDTSISLYAMKVRPLDNGFKSIRYCFHWAFIFISTEQLKPQWARAFERGHTFEHWLLPSSVLYFCHFLWFTLASATQPLTMLSRYIYIFSWSEKNAEGLSNVHSL